MAEVSESVEKPVDSATLSADTLRAMKEDLLLSEHDDIASLVVRKIPQGYPAPFLGRDGLVDPILRRFEENRIFSRGRFGAWKYEVGNQDHCFAQGYECAHRLIHRGGPEMEPTLFKSDKVNQPKAPERNGL